MLTFTDFIMLCTGISELFVRGAARGQRGMGREFGGERQLGRVGSVGRAGRRARAGRAPARARAARWLLRRCLDPAGPRRLPLALHARRVARATGTH